MEKILFIVPPNISFDKFLEPAFNERVVVKKSGNYGSVVTDMPIGVLSLSAYLKKYAAVQTRLIDFNVVLNKIEDFRYESFLELFHDTLSRDQWIDYAPSIIGISTLFTPSYQSMLDIAQCCREMFPDAIIIAGGGVPTNMPDRIFSESLNFDALCYGEGEKPLLGLVEAKDKNEFLMTHRSWITKEKIGRGQMFQHDFINNLDDIPLLDYDILDAADYELKSIKSLFPLAQEKKSMAVMTSRGCYHRCCFCSSHTVHGRKMRYHSISRVHEDIKHLKHHYGAEIIIFQDDHFLADEKRFCAVIGILKEFNLTAFFPNSLALYALDRKILEDLRSVGVNDLVLSVESGSNRVLREIMHKPLNLSIVKRVIADCRELGIASDVSILIGLPGETKQNIEDARAFLRTLYPTWFRISMATPLVGSEMFDVCAKKGYLKGDYLRCDFKRAIIETEDFTPEYIQEKAYSLNLELNFVENSDFRLGNYATALKCFENTLKIKSDHAFAYYFAAKCCQMMGLNEKYIVYKTEYQKIIEKSAFWKNYVSMFGLIELE